MVKTLTTEIRQRGFFGKLFKWLFIVFNILMGIWLATYWVMVGNMIAEQQSDAAMAGGTIGATIGTGALIIFWAAGAAILGGLAMATRGKKISIHETID